MHKIFFDESRRIKKLLSSHSRPRLHSHINHVHSAFFDSQTETIITQHSNTFPSLDFSKSLVVKGDGKHYPRNPTNGYVSKFPDGFFGCLVCEFDSHIYCE